MPKSILHWIAYSVVGLILLSGLRVPGKVLYAIVKAILSAL